MKQKVQLFINNEEVDVFQDGSITIESSIKNVKDPGKIFTDFSKNFTLPASDKNNKVFKHFYNGSWILTSFRHMFLIFFCTCPHFWF